MTGMRIGDRVQEEDPLEIVAPPDAADEEVEFYQIEVQVMIPYEQAVAQGLIRGRTPDPVRIAFLNDEVPAELLAGNEVIDPNNDRGNAQVNEQNDDAQENEQAPAPAAALNIGELERELYEWAREQAGTVAIPRVRRVPLLVDEVDMANHRRRSIENASRNGRDWIGHYVVHEWEEEYKDEEDEEDADEGDEMVGEDDAELRSLENMDQ